MLSDNVCVGTRNGTSSRIKKGSARSWNSPNVALQGYSVGQPRVEGSRKQRRILHSPPRPNLAAGWLEAGNGPERTEAPALATLPRLRDPARGLSGRDDDFAHHYHPPERRGFAAMFSEVTGFRDTNSGLIRGEAVRLSKSRKGCETPHTMAESRLARNCLGG